MEHSQRVLNAAVKAGEILLRNGAEIFRVQETVIIILEAFGMLDHNVYVLSNGIFATVGESRGRPCTAVRNISLGSIHLERITKVNALSREIAQGQLRCLDTIEARLDVCDQVSTTPFFLQLVACGAACASFSYLFGGILPDCLASFLCGLVLFLFLQLGGSKGMSRFMTNILGSALVTLLGGTSLLLGLGAQFDQIIIGAIIPMVPGVALTMSIREFFNGDYLSGSIRLIDAILTAACIAVGVGAAMQLWQFIPGGAAL